MQMRRRGRLIRVPILVATTITRRTGTTSLLPLPFFVVGFLLLLGLGHSLLNALGRFFRVVSEDTGSVPAMHMSHFKEVKVSDEILTGRLKDVDGLSHVLNNRRVVGRKFQGSQVRNDSFQTKNRTQHG